MLPIYFKQKHKKSLISTFCDEEHETEILINYQQVKKYVVFTPVKVTRTSFHLVLTVLILQKQSKKALQSHYIAALL